MAEASQPRRKLMVDLAGLAAALDYSSDSISYYLDLETGVGTLSSGSSQGLSSPGERSYGKC